MRDESDMRVMNFKGLIDKLVVYGGIKTFNVDRPTMKVLSLLGKEARSNILGPHDLIDLM